MLLEGFVGDQSVNTPVDRFCEIAQQSNFVRGVETYLAEAETLAGQTRQRLTVIIDELRPLVLSDKTRRAVLEDY